MNDLINAVKTREVVYPKKPYVSVKLLFFYYYSFKK